MKFLILSLYLLFTISSYSSNISMKRSSKSGFEEEFKDFGEDCVNEMKNSEYFECIPYVTMENYKQVCPSVKSEKCENFYKNALNYFPICRQVPQFYELFEPEGAKITKVAYELKCMTDEEGNLCPFSVAFAINDYSKNTIYDNCSSKTCTETTIELLKKFDLGKISTMSGYENMSYDDISNINKVIKFLKSDDCKSQQISSNSNIKVNINKNLLILVILLQLLLFF